MNIFQKSITPDKPRVLAEEQIYVYVPMATSTNAGIASYNRDQFDIIGSEVSLKWPAESFTQGPIETPSIVKVLDNEFEYTGNLVDLISGNSKISSDKLEVQLKRILRDAYERPELVMLDPNYFVRTIVEKDGKQYYKYNTTAVHYNMSQNLSEDEQAQARQNISASSISDNEATNKRIDALLQTGVYTVNGKTGNVVLKNSDLENDTNYATEQYVQENGGKIDKIVLNNNEQEIINKIVTLTIDKTTVGLSNVDNTSDANKPVSIAQANAINQVQSNLDKHLSNYENPHNVTKTQIGLSNVDNTSDKNKPISDATKQALDTKMDKSGGIFTGNVGVQGNLSVSGTIITKDTETLKVQDNVIVTNANKIELLDLSGLAINKNDTQTYGIMYDVVDDSIKLGLGSIGSDDKFTFNEGEGSPVATRSDSSSLTDNHLLKWDATNNKLVDSGYSAEDKLDKISKSSTHQRAYIVDTDGTQNSIAVSITSTAPNESLIKRDKWGCAEVDTPGYSDIGKTIVNQEYVKTHFYTRADDLKPQYIYTDTIYNWHHDQTDTTKDAYSKIDFTPYSTEILTTTKDDESARIKLGADPRTTSTVTESQAHVDISIGKPNDYSTGISLSNNYQEVFGDGISLYTYQNELTDARILTLSANGLFISEGLELNTETQTAQLKNKKEISPNTIRYDIEQILTNEQKAQARANIGASSISDNEAINNRIDACELQVEANTAARHVHDNKEILDGITASYTTEEKAKLNGIASGAEVNVQADWAQTDSSSKDYIKNKPPIPEGVKLYSSTGENTDGAMTQKAVTDEFKNNLSIQFAESERQKSKNLFDLNYNGTFNSKTETSVSKYIALKSVYGEKFTINTNLPQYSFTRGSVGDIYTNIIFKNLKPNTSYTISFTPISVDNDVAVHFLGVYNVHGKLNTKVTKTITTDENGQFNTGYGIWINGQNTTFTVSNIQLEEGSVATDYQPYNGQITHNGDAPIVFAESERQKSKNLFDYAKFQQVGRPNYYLEVNIGSSIGVYAPVGNSNGIHCWIEQYDENKTLLKQSNYWGDKFILQLEPTTKYLRFDTVSDYAQFMICYANSVDEIGNYQPYNGPIVRDKQLTEQLSNYLPLSGGTMTGKLSFSAAGNYPIIITSASSADTAIRCDRTDTNTSIYFGIGSEGYNRGIYDLTKGGWQVSLNQSNELHIADFIADGKVTIGTGDNKSIQFSRGSYINYKGTSNTLFGIKSSADEVVVGHTAYNTYMRGKADRLSYNDKPLALTSDIAMGDNFTTYTVIDATTLDENTWYPVTFDASRKNLKIMLFNQWNGGNPSWATHSTKNYGCVKIWETTGHGWGELGTYRKVYLSVFTNTNTDPVRGIGQLGNSSTEYVYVRGGGKYNFYTSHNVVPELRTSTYTVASQSIAPTTTAPAEIVQTIMSTDTDQTISGSKTFTSDIKLTKATPLINVTSTGTSGDTSIRFTRNDTGNSCYFGIGSGGVNRGFYDLTQNRWVIYCDGSKSILNSATVPSGQTLTIAGTLSLTSVPKVNGVNVALTSDIPNLLDKVYPVGSIYMSTKNNSPASFLGGTWLQLKDTFLLAHGDTYTSTKSATNSQVTSEAGEATHTLTIEEMPSHNHKTTLHYSGSSGAAGVYGSRNKDARTYTSTSTGGNSPHNNMPPYLVVYMWKRTA